MPVDVTVYDETGAVLRCVSVFLESDAELQAKGGEKWLLGKSDPDRDRVLNGKIVPKPKVELEQVDRAKAEAELRKVRNATLRQKIDTINAVRWDAMSEPERQAWRAYRRALLDLPQNTTDPRNPVWPEPPE